MRIRSLVALPIAVAVIALSACGAELSPEVSGASLAELAEDALEKQIGSRPDISCGDESVVVTEGKKVICLLSDPATGKEYDATVTFTSVDGDKYSIDVKVASEAK